MGGAVHERRIPKSSWSPHRAEQGKVALVRGAWVPDFLSESEAFPQGGHDDQVDAVSVAVALLTVAEPRLPQVF